MDFEITGQVGNVCFLEGLVFLRNKWMLYYGTADSKIAVAEATNYDYTGKSTVKASVFQPKEADDKVDAILVREEVSPRVKRNIAQSHYAIRDKFLKNINTDELKQTTVKPSGTVESVSQFDFTDAPVIEAVVKDEVKELEEAAVDTTADAPPLVIVRDRKSVV